MKSNLSHRLAVGLAVAAGLCLAPARSKADIQILVEEYDAGGNHVGSSITSGHPTPGGSTAFTQSFSYSSDYFNITGTAQTNSNLGTYNGTLNTSFSGGFNSGFDASQDHTIKITVTDDAFASNGAGVKLTNGASVPLSPDGATLQIDAFSHLYDPSSGGVPAGGTKLATGAPVAGPTDVATDILQGTTPIGDPAQRTTTLTTSGLPNPYAIQQEILVQITANGPGGILPDDAFSGTAQARVTSAQAVPAPGGLALALVGLPLVGLRRALRKRAG
jgi:hypothetical protein